MIIQCTKLLADELKIKVTKPDLTNENQLLCWHAHLFKIGRAKCIMLMNNVTRYNFIIYGLLKKDFANIEEIIKKELSSNFFGDEYTEEEINKYLNDLGELRFAATSDRSIISQLNDTIYITEHTIYSQSEKGTTISIYELNRSSNNIPMSKLKGTYFPSKAMKAALNANLM